MTSPEARTAWKCLDQVVPKEWLDRNGHMNMQYYFCLVDRAVAALLTGPLSCAADGAPTPRLALREARIQYRKELFAGQAVEAHIQPRAINGAEIELTCQIVAPSASPGAPPILSAECRVCGCFLNAAGDPASPPQSMVDEIQRRIAAPAEPPIPSSFQIPVHDRHWFVSAEGAVPAVGLDESGELGLQSFVNLFDRGGIGMFAELARSSNVFVSGVGGFALSTGIVRLAPVRAGEPYRIRSRASALGRKTCSFRHELFRADTPEAPAATCDHTMAFIDMTKRRSIFVPDAFRAVLEKRYECEIPAIADGRA